MGSQITALQAIRAARAARERLLANGPVRVEFEDWPLEDGRPFTCFVFPETCGEHDQIMAAVVKARDAGESGRYAGFIETILVRARNEDGSRIFQDAQRVELVGLDADQVRKLAIRISEAEPTPEEIRGNSAIPSSSSAAR